MLSNHTSVITEEETALLMCVGSGFPSVEITWSRDGQAITNSSRLSISEEDVVQEERTILRSFLQIANVQAEDVGVYTCIVSNNETSANSSTQLTLYSKSPIYVI